MAQLLFKTPEYDPKRAYNFAVEFPSEFNINPETVKSINKPTVTLKKREINILNLFRFSRIKPVWGNIQITFSDPIYPSTSEALLNLVELCEKKRGNKFTFKIKSTDHAGTEVESWTIDVKNIVSVEFGKYDYSSKDVQNLKLVLKPSNCILN
jgi:hypothetical protein